MAKNINFAYEPIKIYFLEKKSEFSDHKNLSGSLRKQQKSVNGVFFCANSFNHLGPPRLKTIFGPK
jgi:hypothetical protein